MGGGGPILQKLFRDSPYIVIMFPNNFSNDPMRLKYGFDKVICLFEYPLYIIVKLIIIGQPLIILYLFDFRMGKYQDNEERLADDMHRYKMEAEKFRERMEKAQAEVEVLMAARDKHDQEVGRLRAEIDKVESARARLQLDQERAHSDVNIIQVNLFSLKIYKPQPLCSIFGPFQK